MSDQEDAAQGGAWSKEANDALVAAQKEIGHAVLDCKNPYFSSSYASLKSVIDAVKHALNDNGLSLVQLLGSEGDRVTVETVITHGKGGSMSSKCSAKSPDDPQKLGSVITYLRRYALSAMLCISADEDDDGNAASIGDRAEKMLAVFADINVSEEQVLSHLGISSAKRITKTHIEKMTAVYAKIQGGEADAKKIFASSIEDL
jgi:hypothetical protein